MKKSGLFISVIALTLSLISCGPSESSSQVTSDSTSSATTSSTESSESTVTSKTETSESSTSSEVETSDSSSESSSSESTSETSVSWTEEEAKTMADNCHGVVLPFIELEKRTVQYLEYNETVYISATGLENGFLTKYASKFTGNWYGGDVSVDAFGPSAQEGTAFYFQMRLELDEGTRYAAAYMYTYTFVEDEYDGESYPVPALNGEYLTLTLYDPYLYEFPEFEIRDMLSTIYDYFVDEEDYILPPAFEAEFYQTTPSSVLGFVQNATGLDAEYSEKLEKADFKLLEEPNELGLFVAISPDEVYTVNYKYYSEQSTFYMYFEEYVAPVTSKDVFDNSLLEQFFDNYFLEPFDIPELNITGATYLYEEDPDNFDYYIFDEYEEMNVTVTISSETDGVINPEILTTFVNTITDWKVETNDNGFTITKTDENRYTHTAEFAYNSVDNTILVKIYLYSPYELYTEWPTQEVANLIKEHVEYNGTITDTLPACETNGVKYKINGNTIIFNCEEVEDKDVYDVYNDYVGLLTRSGFETDEYYSEFVSPNSQFVAYMDITSSTTIELFVSNVPEPIPTFDYFPQEELLKALNGSSDFDDTFPALEGADQYEFICNDDHEYGETGYDVYGQIVCTFKVDENPIDIQAIYNDYIKALENAGYKYDDFDYNGYISPNNQLQISAYYETEEEHTGYCTIVINFDNIINGTL